MTGLLKPDYKELADELEKGSGMARLSAPKSLAIFDTKQSSRWFLDFCQQLGTPLSQSSNGDLVLSIRNESYGKEDPRTRGPNTNRRLSFHTDRCDVIAFLCLNPAKSGGENQIVSSTAVEAIIRKERPDLYALLIKPYPYKRHVIDRANPSPFCMQPIFSWKDSLFACSYLRVLIDRADADPNCPELTSQQKEAIDFLDEVCEREKLQTRFTLKAGDLLFLNNWTTLHRRTGFEDFQDPKKRRHLLRVWLSMPNSRPVDEAFRANFGAVEAGALRGGIHPISGQ